VTVRARWAIAGVALAVAAAIAWYLVRGPGRRADDTAVAGTATGSGSSTAPGSGTAAEADPPDAPARIRTIDADQRLALMERIAKARAARTAGKPVVPDRDPADPAPLPGTLSADQVAQAVMDVHTLLLECWTTAVDDLPIKDGKVTVALKLVGEPEVGTLIESSELTGDAHMLAHAELATCIRETTMAIELPPLAEGSALEFTVPMWFSSPADASPN
jgi:hypothetical protein